MKAQQPSSKDSLASAPKRRKTQTSSVAQISENTDSGRKNKRSKAETRPINHDISQGLLRTKPAQPGRKSTPGERKSAPGEAWNVSKGVVLDVDYDPGTATSGLAQRCQARSRFNPVPSPGGVDAQSSNCLEKSTGHSKSTPNDKGSVHSHDAESIFHHASTGLNCVNLLDFEPPPSAQIPIFPASEPLERSEHITAIESTDNSVGEYTHVDDHVSKFVDDYSIDDECLEEAMQSVIAQTDLDDLVSEREPLDGSSGIFDDDLQDWPEILDPPEAISIHNDTPCGLTDAARDTPPPIDFQSSHLLSHVSGNAGNSKSNPLRLSEGSENIFDEDFLDGDSFDVTSNSSDILQPETPQPSPHRPTTPKLQWLPPKIYVPDKSSQASAPPVKPSQPPVSPAKISRVPVSPLSTPKVSHLISFTPTGSPVPILRPAFPSPTPDRSPIPGLTNGISLRICFRIGEALNAAATASRSNIDAIIELYARVIFSSRQPNGGFKQLFQFGDLFTDKPPYLKGTYGLWKGVGLWDQDSRSFVGEGGKGKMARVVGRIRRGDGGVEMTVLSVWEIGWEDVGIAKGVVCF